MARGVNLAFNFPRFQSDWASVWPPGTSPINGGPTVAQTAWPKKACKQDLWGCPGLWHLGVGSGSFGSCGERHGASMDWAFSSRAQGCSGIWRPCRYPGLLVKFLGPLSSFCHCLVGWTTGCCCHEGVNLALFWWVYLLNRTQCFPAEHFNKMINVNSFTHHWF